MKAFIIVVISLFLVTLNGICQSKNKVGIVFNLENIAAGMKYVNSQIQKIPISRICFTPGISYERKITVKSNIELELRFKQNQESYFVFPPRENQPFGANFYTQNYITQETVINLPICYKFNSKFINFSVGPTIEYLIEAKQLNVNPYSFILGKEAYPKKWSIGFIGKISKTINVYKSFSVEPSFFYNPILSYSKNYLGIALLMNYNF